MSAAVLPELYGRWVHELVGGDVPAETNATCSNCAMCAKDGSPHDGRTAFFDSSTKCCTWVPGLPNFLVGRILGDARAEARLGRETVEKRIAERVGVTPLGVATPPKHEVLYRETVVNHPEGAVFGRTRAFRCPHYDLSSGGCSIWRHRDSTCTTWFCKHVRGLTGSRFWVALHGLLREIERTLSLQVLFELGLDIGTIEQCFRKPNARLDADEIDAVVSEETWAMRWGAWAGRETELYLRSAEIAEALSWADVARIGGPELAYRAGVARENYGRLMTTDLPARLRPARLRVLPMVGESLRVETYSPYDAVDVSPSVLELLSRFDGRPTAEVVESLAAEGIDDGVDLVRHLVDFALVEPQRG